LRGGRPGTPAGGHVMAVSRSRRVRRGTTTSAAAWRRRAHGTLAGEGHCRWSIGPSLSAQCLRSTSQPVWRRRRSQEWRRRAAQPAEAGDARGIAGIGPEAASRLRPGSHHPRHRRGASWVGRGAAAADADAASSRSARSGGTRRQASALSHSGPTHDHTHAAVNYGSPPLLPRDAPSPAAWLGLLIIALYRKAISPLLPSACRYIPSCSEYGYEAVARYGILAGGRMAIWRILRCNPFGGSGYDPVP
jgi:putative membrane protein insertion efficiency factor